MKLKKNHNNLTPPTKYTMNFGYIESRKGARLIYFEGYLFKKSKVNQNGDIVCVCRRSSCKVRGKISSDNMKTSTFDHEYACEVEEVEVMKSRNAAIKSAVEQPTTSMKRLYSVAFSGEPDNDAIIPPFKSLKSSMYRNRAERPPKQPRTLEEMNVSGEWRLTKSDADFLQIDDGNQNRILVLFTIPFLRIMTTARDIYMDGTFHVAANLFYQVYIIYAYVFKSMIPICYALLPDKSEETYKRLFKMIIQKASQYNLEIRPSVIQVDFEKAVLNAIEHCFPQSSIRGCYFHYTQSIWRGVQRYGLTTSYREDNNVREVVRRALGLPFLPTDRIDEVWEQVIAECPESCQEFVDYVTSTYVDDIEAMFSREIWCHFDNDSGIRTNNALESRNGKLRNIFHRHPNIYRFIECLKEVQAEEEANVRMLRSGISPSRQRRRYTKATSRLQRLKANFLAGELSAWDYCGYCSTVSCS